MRVKGTTKIELTNVKTGERETFTHENFVTEFASEYFKEGGALNSNPVGSLQDTRPLDDLFGGIMLFDKKIDQNTDEHGNHPHPLYCPAGTKMTANGSIDFTSNSNATELGQYDATESGTPNERQRVYVYNWDTDEGNGKINSVCLTTAAGGYIGAGNATSGVKDTSTGALTRRPFHYSGTASITRTFASEEEARLAGLDLSQSQVALLADTAKDTMNAGSVTINWYDVPVSKLNPFINKNAFTETTQTPKRTQTHTFTARANVANARVMGGTGYILLVGSTSTGATSGATVYAVQINKDGTITEKNYNMQANAGIAMNDANFIGGKIIGNDLYLAYGSYEGSGNTTRVRIKADGTVVTQTITGNGERTFFTSEGRVYLGSVQYYDTTADETYITNASVWNGGSTIWNTGLWQCYDSNLVFSIHGTQNATDPKISPLAVLRPHCNWLSTINNLQNEVEKTADKTMKVTYTLTLVENQQT